MSGKPLIRLATEKDAAAIREIYAPFITDSCVSFEMEIPDLPEIESRIRKVNQQGVWLICEMENQVAGYAYAGEHRARAAYNWAREVSVYLRPAFESRGVAAALYTSLFSICNLRGFSNYLAGITLPNPKSLRFHQKMGFQPVGTYHNIGYKFGQWHDVIWLELFLGKTNEAPARILSLDEVILEKDWSKALHAGLDLIR
ncbi:MAG: N-acetyltransferase [Bacteroidia bacterium]|nr:N-acetyltransferase [Bacteroidia bacterium]